MSFNNETLLLGVVIEASNPSTCKIDAGEWPVCSGLHRETNKQKIECSKPQRTPQNGTLFPHWGRRPHCVRGKYKRTKVKFSFPLYANFSAKVSSGWPGICQCLGCAWTDQLQLPCLGTGGSLLGPLHPWRDPASVLGPGNNQTFWY